MMNTTIYTRNLHTSEIRPPLGRPYKATNSRVGDLYRSCSKTTKTALSRGDIDDHDQVAI